MDAITKFVYETWLHAMGVFCCIVPVLIGGLVVMVLNWMPDELREIVQK